MREYDTLIIGGGIAGLATAWAAAERGASRVLLLERETDLGVHSSGRNAAMLRTFSGDPLLDQLARETAEFLRDPPPGFAEAELVDRRGMILKFAAAAAPKLAPALRARSDAEALDADTLRRVAPHFEVPATNVWRFRDDGRIDIAALLEGLARAATAAGAELRTGVSVAELVVQGGAVRGAVCANGRVIEARCTVLAAGGWAGRLGRAAGSPVSLRPTRRHLFVTEPLDDVDPAWPIVWSEEAGFYARPESPGLLLSACDQVDTDPDTQATDPAVLELVLQKLASHLPRFADAGVAHSWTGVRTLTADGRFALGPDPVCPGLFWVAGLGGHGMSCGIAAGRLAARLLDHPDSADPVVRSLDPARLVGHARGTAAP